MENVRIMTELDVLNSAMKDGFVAFKYVKANGETRFAIGTRNLELIEKTRGKKFADRKGRGFYTQRNGYWDLIACDWRQFSADRFVGLVFADEHKVLSEKHALVLAITCNRQTNELDLDKVAIYCNLSESDNFVWSELVNWSDLFVDFDLCKDLISVEQVVPTEKVQYKPITEYKSVCGSFNDLQTQARTQRTAQPTAKQIDTEKIKKWLAELDDNANLLESLTGMQLNWAHEIADEIRKLV